MAAIALGSNLGDRRAHIEAAFCALSRVPGIKLLARGPILETAPLTKAGVNSGGPYLNSAAVIRTTLEAHQLLARLHHIERDHGRERNAKTRWQARTLDLDLLLYADQQINDPGLRVPHPEMSGRAFVLTPLAAISPGWIVPGIGRSVAELAISLAAVAKNAGSASRGVRARARGASKRTGAARLGKPEGK